MACFTRSLASRNWKFQGWRLSKFPLTLRKNQGFNSPSQQSKLPGLPDISHLPGVVFVGFTPGARARFARFAWWCSLGFTPAFFFWEEKIRGTAQNRPSTRREPKRRTTRASLGPFQGPQARIGFIHSLARSSWRCWAGARCRYRGASLKASGQTPKA